MIAPHSQRTFVEKLDFRTTVGHGDGPGARERLGFRGKGPTAVITDLGVLEPDPETKVLMLTQIHPGVDVNDVREQTGWDLKVASALQPDRARDRGGALSAPGAARPVSAAYVLDAVRAPFGRYGGVAGQGPARRSRRARRQGAARPDSPGSTPSRSTTSCSATPTRPARTTATSRGWPALLTTCRPAFLALRSTGCAARASTRRCRRSRAIETGDASIVLVGGVESMSRAPWVHAEARTRIPAQHETLYSTTLGWRMVNPKMPDQWTISLGAQRREARGHLRDLTRGAGRVRAPQPPAPRRPRGTSGFYGEWVIPVPAPSSSATRTSGPTPRWRSWPS